MQSLRKPGLELQLCFMCICTQVKFCLWRVVVLWSYVPQNYYFWVGHGRVVFYLLVVTARIHICRESEEDEYSVVCQIQHVAGTVFTITLKHLMNFQVFVSIFVLNYTWGKIVGFEDSSTCSICICMCFFMSLFFLEVQILYLLVVITIWTWIKYLWMWYFHRSLLDSTTVLSACSHIRFPRC